MSELRGSRARFVGLCDQCGKVTTRLNADKQPRHEGCETVGQITVEEAIANAVAAGLIADPDDW